MISIIRKHRIDGTYLYYEIPPTEIKPFREFVLRHHIRSLYANLRIEWVGCNDPDRPGWQVYSGLFSSEDAEQIEKFVSERKVKK